MFDNKPRLRVIWRVVLVILKFLLSFIVFYFTILGVLAGSTGDYLFKLFSDELVRIHDGFTLDWVFILACFLAFYFEGLITRTISVKLLPILYLQLLVFVDFGKFDFPFNVVLIFFATLGLLLARAEIKKLYKLIIAVPALGIFIVYLFSQPLIIEKKHFGRTYAGDYVNAIKV